MICPVDKTEMRRVKIVSHYGQPIELDQCQSCGGIWFDEAELFRAKQGEAEKIEALNTDTLKNPSLIENTRLLCPRDHSVLQRFTDRHFPQDIILARCSLCSGIWLNRGLFTKYQQFRQELARPKEKSPEDEKLEESIKQMVADYKAGHSSATLKNLGEYLSADPLADEKAAGVALDALSTILMVLSFLAP